MRFTAVGFFASDCLSLVLNHTASEERSIMRANRLAEFGLFFGVAISIAGAAHAQSSLSPSQDPSIGGQANSCWGTVAAQLAKIGMGDHSKSAKAPGFTFADTGIITEPRNGVGNQSRLPEAPHQTQPGDGGNGQHAANNAALTDPTKSGFGVGLDPIDGGFITDPNDPHILAGCTDVAPNLKPPAVP
jgi:hypothetical protein